MAQFKTLFGRKPGQPLALEDARRDLLHRAVQQVLHAHRIPPDWVQPETSPATTASQRRGFQLQLVLRHWEPKFLPYTVALQREILWRILQLDPSCAAWVTGVSWRFDPLDERLCPALTDTAFWRTDAAAGRPARGPMAPLGGAPHYAP